MLCESRERRATPSEIEVCTTDFSNISLSDLYEDNRIKKNKNVGY